MKRILLIIILSLFEGITNGQQFSNIKINDLYNTNVDNAQSYFKSSIDRKFTDLIFFQDELVAFIDSLVFTSSNNGSSWQQILSCHYKIESILAVDSYLFLFTSSGTFRTSFDSLKLEQIFYNGETLKNVVACQSEGSIYLITESRMILKSVDYCYNFEKKGMAVHDITKIFKYGDYIFEINHWYNTQYKDQGELFYSVDDCSTWTQIGQFPGEIGDVFVKDENVIVATHVIYQSGKGSIYSAPLNILYNIEWEAHSTKNYSDIEDYEEFIFALEYWGNLTISNNLFFSMDKVQIPANHPFKIIIANGYLFICCQDQILRTEINKSLINKWINDGELIIADGESIIADPSFSLLQNYPNPFNSTTTISFMLPVDSFVTLKIYDVVGREVTTLFNERLSAGEHSILWNAANLCSGIYYYKLNAKSDMGTDLLSEIKKMVLIK